MEMFGSPVNRKPPGGASVGIDLTGEDDVKLAPGESAWMAKEDAEKALADLVKDIYADMTEVDMAEATPDGLVSWPGERTTRRGEPNDLPCIVTPELPAAASPSAWSSLVALAGEGQETRWDPR